SASATTCACIRARTLRTRPDCRTSSSTGSRSRALRMSRANASARSPASVSTSAGSHPGRPGCRARSRHRRSRGWDARSLEEPDMIFEEIRTGGCCAYVVACAETCAGVVVDPELSQLDRTLGVVAKAGVHVRYVVDTHTHADHFSASRELARRLGIPRVMHRASIAPEVD